jgi:hypothetical protein
MATDVSGVTTHFPKPQNGFATTLGSTIAHGAATVSLASTGNYTNGDVVVLVIEPTSATAKEVFVGTISTSSVSVTGCVWTVTAAGSPAHTAGVAIVDYTTATHLAMMSKGLLVAHNADGTIKTNAAITTNAATLTTPKVVTSINDSAGNEVIKTPATASAVNELTVTNAATGSPVLVGSTGDDTDVDLKVNAKGAGIVKLGGVHYQSNTTNSVTDDTILIRGWGFIQGDGVNRSIQETVTFPITFDAVPVVTATAVGVKAGSDPTSPNDTIGVTSMSFAARIYQTSTSQVNIQIIRSSSDGNDPGTLGANDRLIYTWIAIGVKA